MTDLEMTRRSTHQQRTQEKKHATGAIRYQGPTSTCGMGIGIVCLVSEAGSAPGENAMDDLTLTKLCAEAMGVGVWESTVPRYRDHLWVSLDDADNTTYRYDPLHDDAQAMALVKKFHIDCDWSEIKGEWLLVIWGEREGEMLGNPILSESMNPDLNRAIVECVAKMQGAKVVA